MPQIMPDTSQATDFKASRPGNYKMTIKSVEVVRSKEPNKKTGTYTNGIQPTFEFKAPRNSDGEDRVVERRKWIAIDGKGTLTFDQLLRCTGNAQLADEIKANPGRVGFDPDTLVGKEVVGVVVTSNYTDKNGNSQLQDDIDSFLPI